jgi:cobaltochelatase CobS
MMADTARELEQRLGPRADFIITPGNKALVRRWAVAVGYNPVDVAVMSAAELANLYHEGPPGNKHSAEPTDHQKLAADIFVKMMEALNLPGFNVSTMREIATQQFNSHFASWSDAIAIEIQKRIDALPPKQLQITSATGSVIINGPLHYKTETVIKVASIGHPIMLVGPAGCGKTTIGEHVSRALQLPFYITSTINETHELTGFIDGNGRYHSTPFRQAFEFGGIWVADEIDAWDAAALLAANAALANGYSIFPDDPRPIARNVNFRMVATANTFGNGADRVYIGRNELDAASLDRFAIIPVDYDMNLEQIFANGNQRWLDRVWHVRKKVNEKKIRHVVSSRAIAMGSAALAIGLNWNEVENMYLFKGMSESDREKCK